MNTEMVKGLAREAGKAAIYVGLFEIGSNFRRRFNTWREIRAIEKEAEKEIEKESQRLSEIESDLHNELNRIVDSSGKEYDAVISTDEETKTVIIDIVDKVE